MDDTLDIIFDIDGVLSDFTFAYKTFVRKFHRIPVAPTGAKKSWQFLGMESAAEDAIWQRVASGEYDWSQQPSLLSEMDVYAMWALRYATPSLRQTVQFQYVTSRLGPQEQVVKQTTAWLASYGLPDPNNVTVSGRKVDAIKEQGLRPIALIDDDIRNIVAYGAAFGDEKVWVRDWKYNRPDEVERVYGIASSEWVASWARGRVSSIAEFCYDVLESLDGVNRG